MAIIKKSVRKKNEPSSLDIKKIKLLFIIVDRGQAIKYMRENEKHDVTTQLVLLGHGTASLALDYLGLGDIKKDVIISVIKEEKCAEIMSAIENRIKHAKGIAFTIPITSMIGLSIYKFITKSPIETNKEVKKDGK